MMLMERKLRSSILLYEDLNTIKITDSLEHSHSVYFSPDILSKDCHLDTASKIPA